MPLSISNSQAPSFGNFLSTLLKDIGVCVKSGVFLCKLRLLGGAKRVSPHPEWVAGRRACRKIILCLRLKDGVQTKQNRKRENAKDRDETRKGSVVTPSARPSPGGSQTHQRHRGTGQSQFTQQGRKHSAEHSPAFKVAKNSST